MIHCHIQSKDEALKCFLIGVYGFSNYKDKYQLWNELYSLQDHIASSWLILKDFDAF